jgi:hypothetical protein
MLFLAISTSSFEKALFSPFAHFFFGSLIFEEFRFLSSCTFWYLSTVRCITGRDFLPLCGQLCQFTDHFFLFCVCRRFLISYCPICQPFLLVAEPLLSILESKPHSLLKIHSSVTGHLNCFHSFLLQMVLLKHGCAGILTVDYILT